MSIFEVWLFSGTGGRFSSGVFTTKDKAMDWIKVRKLSGTLTKYPVDCGVYEWAINNKLFEPSKESEFSPAFIQKFSCASQEHYHFEDGAIE